MNWYTRLPGMLAGFIADELEYGTLWDTMSKTIQNRKLTFALEMSISDLLEKAARNYKDKKFILWQDESISFQEMDRRANRCANYLENLGYGPGRGMALLMNNSPDYLPPYFASQKLGMYAVPVNTSLLGDGLQYILSHSEAEILVVDYLLLKNVKPLLKNLPAIKKIFVRFDSEEEKRKAALDSPFYDLQLMQTGSKERKDSWHSNPDDISSIMYTSGTTGLPKGVVYRYGNNYVRKAEFLARATYTKDDVIFTCLPLFHANALFLSITASLSLGIPLALSVKFSASKFWKEVCKYEATTFNALGAMISILLKQPPAPEDKTNKVRLVLSAACPANKWKEFEDRYGVTIWEGYSAVDGGGNGIFNFGTAPVGSIGKPLFGVKYRIVDDENNDVPAGVPGELIFEEKSGKNKVEFFKNENASREKWKDGYIYTGDLVYKDKKGFLYFVGRKTESMRRRGENVSAYEVESLILKHPSVLECAVYGVPSELGEDDIMVSLVLVEGKKLSAEELKDWLQDKLAAYAIPRYYRFMSALPKTETHRVIKKSLKDAGVTEDTVDLDDREKKKEVGTKSLQEDVREDIKETEHA